MIIWLIDHYTNPPQDLGDARHFSNARELMRRGHEVRVIACTFTIFRNAHYPPETRFIWRNDLYDGVPFTLIRASSYRTNYEMARMWNMLQFAVRAWKGEWAKGLNAPNLILGSSPDPFVALALNGLRAGIVCRLFSRYAISGLIRSLR